MAIEWGKCSSRQAAKRSTWSRRQPLNAMTLERLGVASVRVPVLSKTMVSAAAISSKWREPLTVKPALALWLIAESTAMEPVSLRAHE